MQQVGVDRIGRVVLLALGDRDVMGAGELEQLGAALECPFAPRRDDLDAGLQRVIGELEAHLVVALAGGAVADGVGSGPPGDVDLRLADQRSRDRRAEQVDALVDGIGAEHGEHEVADELLAQVLDEDIFRLDAELQCLLAGRAQLLALAEVGGEGDHLAAVLALQPLEDDRGVEAARVGQHDLLHATLACTLGCRLRRHIPPLPKCRCPAAL